MQNKLLYKALIGSVCLMIGSGCSFDVAPENTRPTTSSQQARPAANVPAPAPAPVEAQRFLAEVLIGASMNALQSSLGQPDIIFAEQNARFLRYDAPGCAVHILMKEGRVIEVTPRKRNGRPLGTKAADNCFHEMVVARRAAADDED